MKTKQSNDLNREFSTQRSTKFNVAAPFNRGLYSVKNSIKKSPFFSERVWIRLLIGLAFSSILVGLIIFLIYLFKLNPNYTIFADDIDVEKMGQTGDFVGGVIGAIWSLTGVLLFYATLRLQSKEFKENRIHFQLSRLTEIIYRQLEIFNKHLDHILLKDIELDANGQSKEYKGRAAIVLLSKRVDAIGALHKKVELTARVEDINTSMTEHLAFIELNITELLNIYEELGSHVDTIRAVLIKEDIPTIDLNELKGIFFKNIGREFLNSSENLLPILNWYIDYRKKTDSSYEELGSVEKLIKRKLNSIKKFRHTYYDKETIERYIDRREMYNIHYF